MSLKIDELADEVRLTFTMPKEDLFHPLVEDRETTGDDWLEEMLHQIVLNHGRVLGSAVFDPLMEGMLEFGKDVIEPELARGLRLSFEGSMVSRGA